MGPWPAAKNLYASVAVPKLLSGFLANGHWPLSSSVTSIVLLLNDKDIKEAQAKGI